MKKIQNILIVLGVCLAGLFPQYVRAADPAPAAAPAQGITDQEKEFGKTLLPLVGQFGFTEYTYAAKTPNGIVVFEYLKPGSTIETWKEISTVTLIPVGTTTEEGIKAVEKIGPSFQTQAKAIDKSEHKTSFGNVYYSHYEIGQDALKEDNLSAIWQLYPGVVVNFQVQKRPDAQTPETIESFKKFVSTITDKKEPTAKTESKSAP